MTEETPALSNADHSYKIVLLKTLMDLIGAEFDQSKGVAGEQMLKGETVPARVLLDGQDIKLGSINKSDPKPRAEVRDPAALDAYIMAEHADKLVRKAELADPGEVIPVLIDAGRADLFTEVDVIPDWLRKQVLTSALKGADVPGVIVRTPGGTVSARAELAAEYVARRLLSGARVPLLGIEA